MFEPQQIEVLKDLSEVISFNELKRLRLVCKDFNAVIKGYPRYVKSQVTFGANWRTNLRTLKNITQWKNVYFRSFQFKPEQFSGPYWNDMKQNLTTLVFHKLRVFCENLAQFVNDCCSLENITIEHIYFSTTTADVGENGRKEEVIKYCTHDDSHEAVLLPRPVTIRKIIFNTQNVIPICLLDVLRKRCLGRLTDFGYNGQIMKAEDRMICIPSRTAVFNIVRNILIENVDTVRKVSLCNNVNDEFLMVSLHTEIGNLMLHKVSLANSKDGYIEPRLYMMFLENINKRTLDLGRQIIIQELDLNFVGSNINIGQSLTNLLNQIKSTLRVLQLRFNGKLTGPTNLGLNILHEANNLTTLSVLHKRGQGQIDQEFLQNLPASLKHLSVQLTPNILFNEDMFFNFIDNIRSNNIRMTKLFIGKAGNFFRNIYMHEIIREMPLLQDLQITGASELTDNGLYSAITNENAEEILKCKSYFLLSEPPLKFEEAKRYNNEISIARLTSLRIVTFKKCNISDISIRLAFHLPNIRNVDLSNNLNVSDIGLFWLCQQNPTIEQLVIQDNIRVSHFGINQLVTNNPTLMKIITTKQVHGRHFKGLDYPRSVYFDKVVTTSGDSIVSK